jgi:lipoprotein-anchoring transpeptidase ErfK/SrfK
MKILATFLALLIGTAVLAQTPARKAATPPAQQAPLAPQAPQAPQAPKTDAFSDTVAVQVMLDRAGFSPGAIDGQAGSNLKRALAAFQRANGLAESGLPDDQTRERLTSAGSVPPLTTYQISEADVAGPFTSAIPSDLVAQSKLEKLGYQNSLEVIAERFHASPQLLRRVNTGASFSKAGEQIQVPNVEPFEVPQPATIAPQRGRGRGTAQQGSTAQQGGTAQRGAAPAGRGRRGETDTRGTAGVAEFTIAVTKSTSALTVEDSSGRVVFHAPVTTGSEHDPLPIGNWKVTTIQVMPKFNYNPDLFWDANPGHSKATIPSGPNNPVGVAWIDLTKEHYGIHGTPEPSNVGHVQSHGCVRLTNWDVQRLLKWAQPGTPVVFRE